MQSEKQIQHPKPTELDPAAPSPNKANPIPPAIASATDSWANRRPKGRRYGPLSQSSRGLYGRIPAQHRISSYARRNHGGGPLASVTNLGSAKNRNGSRHGQSGPQCRPASVRSLPSLRGSPECVCTPELLLRYEIAFDRQFSRALGRLLAFQPLPAARQPPQSPRVPCPPNLEGGKYSTARRTPGAVENK